MVVMLQQFEGVAGFHRAAVAGALKAFAFQLQRFNAQPDQRLAFVVRAVGVLAGEVVDLEIFDIALLVQALHSDRQAIGRLTVIEGLDSDLSGLQLAITAPLGNGVGCLGRRAGRKPAS